MVRVGHGFHVRGGSPLVHGIHAAGGEVLGDGQGVVRGVKDRPAGAVGVGDGLGGDAAVAAVGVVRQGGVIEGHRQRLGVEGPAHDGPVLEPGAPGIGNGDLRVLHALGLHQRLDGGVVAVNAHNVHYRVLAVFLRGGGLRGLLLGGGVTGAGGGGDIRGAALSAAGKGQGQGQGQYKYKNCFLHVFLHDHFAPVIIASSRPGRKCILPEFTEIKNPVRPRPAPPLP